MSKRDENRIHVPENEKGPSWVAIIILFVIGAGAFPVGAVGLYLLVKKLMAMSRNKKYSAFREYAVIIGARPYVQISELARTTGKAEETVRQELQEMIEKGFMGKRAFVDKSTGCVVIDPSARPEEEGARRAGDGSYVREERYVREVWNSVAGSGSLQTAMDPSARQAAFNGNVAPGPKSQPAQVRPVERTITEKAPEAQSKPKSAPAQPAENEFEAILRQIREVNQRIDDGPMSDKIDRIGELTASIFQVVQQRPDRKDEVHKFMSYYLPTTMKLLESYSLLEKQSYQGQNIQSARKDIEKIIGTMVPAFEKQLDRLFQADALDISADIDVLETMIAKDGLSEQQMTFPARR